MRMPAAEPFVACIGPGPGQAMPIGDGDMIEQTDAWTDFDAAEVFDAFGGCWRQVRVMAPGGRFSGMATFTALDIHTFAYHEEGIATFDGGATLPCYRDYAFGWRRNRSPSISTTRHCGSFIASAPV